MGTMPSAPDIIHPKASRNLSSLVRAFGGYAGLSVAGQLLGLAALAIAARRLGPVGIGAYTFSLGVTTYFLLPTNFGFNAIAIRDVATKSMSMGVVVRDMLTLQLGVALLMYALLAALAGIIAPSQLTETILLIVALQLFTNAASLDWALQSTGRLVSVGAWRFGSQCVYLLLVWVFVRHSGDTPAFAAANIVGYTVFAIGTVVVVLRGLRMPSLRISLKGLASRARRSAPVGYAMAMVQIYYYFDSILLQYLKGSAVVGLYGVAYRLPLAFIGVASLWTNAVMPYAARLAISDRDRLRRDLGTTVTASCVIAGVVMGYSVILGPKLIPFLFGARFGPGATAFAILMGAAVIVLISTSLSPVLVGVGYARGFAFAATLGAIVNIVLNFALIPPYGINGAACATVAAEATTMTIAFVLIRRRLGPLPINWLRVACVLLGTVGCIAITKVIALLWASGELIGIVLGLVLLLPIAIWALSIPELIRSRMAPASEK
jgi:O-antigen/teichoic acid export membrane protein